MSLPTEPSYRRYLPTRALWNLLLAGALLRLFGLGAGSLWLDEGVTWSWATKPGWIDTALGEANHPPVWWLVTRAWISVFGDGLVSLRAPAALMGLLSVVLTWFVALRVFDPAQAPRRGGFPTAEDGGEGRRIAIWVTGLVAVSSYFVESALEARMYPALLAETLALTLLYLRWLDRGDRLSLVAYAVVGTIALYTHYFAVWPLWGHALHVLWLRRTRGKEINPWPFVAAVLAAGLAFVPWFVYLLGHYAGMAPVQREPFGHLLYVVWRMGAGPGLVVADQARAAEGPNAVLAQEAFFVAIVAALWLVPVAIGCLRVTRRPGLRSLVAATVLFPAAALLAIHPWFPLLDERYLVFLAPWIFALAVMGARGFAGSARVVFLGGLVAVTALGVVAFQGASDLLVPKGRAGTLDGRIVPLRFVPDPDTPLTALHHGHPAARTPWNQVYQFVSDHAEPGDLVALHPWYAHYVWDYYAARDENALERIHLPRTEKDVDEILAEFGDQLKGRRRVFLVMARGETQDTDHYHSALGRALVRVWLAEERGFASVGPIRFELSWGVRLSVFTGR